jgi:hypothetical protein
LQLHALLHSTHCMMFCDLPTQQQPTVSLAPSLLFTQLTTSAAPAACSLPQAPKNPITGEPLTPVSDVRKEGYQAGQAIGQTENTKARVLSQLDGQPGGRPFGGKGMRVGRLYTPHTAVLFELHCVLAHWD